MILWYANMKTSCPRQLLTGCLDMAEKTRVWHDLYIYFLNILHLGSGNARKGVSALPSWHLFFHSTNLPQAPMLCQMAVGSRGGNDSSKVEVMYRMLLESRGGTWNFWGRKICSSGRGRLRKASWCLYFPANKKGVRRFCGSGVSWANTPLDNQQVLESRRCF